jgi:rare lipoprotein A
MNMCRMNHMKLRVVLSCAVLLYALAGQAQTEPKSEPAGSLQTEAETPVTSKLEELILKGSELKPAEGFASYYAKRFEGRRTTSGHRYHPEKMTAAHQSLPLGTVVRVVNPVTNQEVHVTINDRCAKKTYHFIDLSRAAAKKIGLWGKGKIKVVIIPLLEGHLEEPV